MKHPQTIAALAVTVDGAGVDVNEYVFFQARQIAVVGEFQTSVVCRRNGR